MLAPLLGAALLAGAAPLTLDEAVARARAANFALAASRLAVAAEGHSLAAAQSEFALRFVPTSRIGRIGAAEAGGDSTTTAVLGVLAQRKLEWGTVLAAGPVHTRAGGSSTTALGVHVQQPLFAAFGREVTLDPLHQASFALESAGRSLERAVASTTLDTVAAYYDALRFEGTAELAAGLAERLARHALVAARKERAGLASPMDTLRAEIRRRDALDTANQSRSAQEAALGRLRLLLAIDAATPLVLAEPATPVTDPGPHEERAMESRVELVQLRAELAEARRAAEVARRGTLPDATLNLTYGTSAATEPWAGAFVAAPRREWSLFVQTSGDLRRTAERERYRRAIARSESLAQLLAEKQHDIRREVRQQLRSIEEVRERTTLREEQIRHAEVKLALAEIKFRHDMADNFDLVEAETELHAARAALLAARSEYAVGVHALRAAIGAPVR